jgi:RNA polymerase sigma factor (sigma-70 family)
VNEAQAAAGIPHYEGLIFTTTSQIVELVEEDFDDILQHLRITVWRALLAFKPERYADLTPGARHERQRSYVFSCVQNRKKDVLKRVRRGDRYIEDEAEADPDHFECRYLVETPDTVYGEIEDGELVLPSTLDELERHVVVYLYAGRTQVETAEVVGLTPNQMQTVMRRIRWKLADWKPSSEPAVPPPRSAGPSPAKRRRRAAGSPAARAA